MSPGNFSVINRVGRIGRSRLKMIDRNNALYGEGNWSFAFIYQGRLITQQEALQLYEDSYSRKLAVSPDLVRRMVFEASEVYDFSIENINSGLDYNLQEGPETHIQDIAVRRVLAQKGVQLKGGKPLQIRGLNSDLHELNPGLVPFVDPDAVLDKPRIYQATWIEPGSVEDFWQNNRVLIVKQPASKEEQNQAATKLANLLSGQRKDDRTKIDNLVRSRFVQGLMSPKDWDAVQAYYKHLNLAQGYDELVDSIFDSLDLNRVAGADQGVFAKYSESLESAISGVTDIESMSLKIKGLYSPDLRKFLYKLALEEFWDHPSADYLIADLYQEDLR